MCRLIIAVSMLAVAGTSVSAQVLPLPPRPVGAMTGSEFRDVIDGLSWQEREALIWQEIVQGNVPEFMRDLVEITVTENIGGVDRTARHWATPDHMAVGSDADFFRMPMSTTLAQQVADLLECSLITRKMSDDIWAHAALQLNPQPFSPSSYDITAVSTFWLSQEAIESQRAGNPLGLLVAGIKKDVVITPLIALTPNKVFIYGWHWPTGVPIQPLYGGHVDWYADYSHGIRLMQRAMTVDGAPTTVAEVLADADLSALLSDEGAFEGSRYPVPETPASNGLSGH